MEGKDFDGNRGPPQNNGAPAAAVGGIFGKLKDAMGGSALRVSAISVLIFVIVIAAVVWVFMSYIRPTRGVTVSGTKSPVNGQVLNVIDIPPIKMTNGISASVSFWLYIHDATKYAGSPRHILHIGGPDMVKPYNSTSEATMINEKDALKVFMGENDTKLTVSFGSAKVDIPYIPLQRWTHICVTISDTNVNAGGQVTAYADGIQVSQATHIMQGAQAVSVNTNLYGTLYVGGDHVKGTPFSGLLGQTTLFNYELNTRDINRVYRNGPVAGLSKYGLAWGIRAPIYKLN